MQRHGLSPSVCLPLAACAVELYQVSSLRMIGHHLLCLLNGNYAPVQCDGRYCSCVDEHVNPSDRVSQFKIVINFVALASISSFIQVFTFTVILIERHVCFIRSERFLLHRATIEHTDFARLPHGVSSSLCLTHLEQVRNANVTDDHILIPVSIRVRRRSLLAHSLHDGKHDPNSHWIGLRWQWSVRICSM